MDPIGGGKGDFQPDGKGNSRNAAKADDKECRAVGRVSKAVVKATMGTAAFQLQETVENTAFTTSWTSALDAGLDRRKFRPTL